MTDIACWAPINAVIPADLEQALRRDEEPIRVALGHLILLYSLDDGGSATAEVVNPTGEKIYLSMASRSSRGRYQRTYTYRILNPFEREDLTDLLLAANTESVSCNPLQSAGRATAQSWFAQQCDRYLGMARLETPNGHRLCSLGISRPVPEGKSDHYEVDIYVFQDALGDGNFPEGYDYGYSLSFVDAETGLRFAVRGDLQRGPKGGRLKGEYVLDLGAGDPNDRRYEDVTLRFYFSESRSSAR